MGARVIIKGVTANLSQRPALNWLPFTLTLYQSRGHRVKKSGIHKLLLKNQETLSSRLGYCSLTIVLCCPAAPKLWLLFSYH
jgi:hypothetical protein